MGRNGAGAAAQRLFRRCLPRAEDPRHHPEGQLTGMLDEVGVYRDRDRYLARSLQVTSRMEALVGDLTISRMESGTGLRKEEVDLSRLVEEQLEQDRELLDQRGDGPLPVPGPRPRPPGRSQPAGTGGGQSAVQRGPVLPRRGPHPGAHPAPGRAAHPGGGEHRCPDWGGGPPRLFEPFYREEQSGTDAPAAAVWGSTW